MKGGIVMVAVKYENETGCTESKIIQFPTSKKEEKDNNKERTYKTTRKSTKMQCLHDK